MIDCAKLTLVRPEVEKLKRTCISTDKSLLYILDFSCETAPVIFLSMSSVRGFEDPYARITGIFVRQEFCSERSKFKVGYFKFLRKNFEKILLNMFLVKRIFNSWP